MRICSFLTATVLATFLAVPGSATVFDFVAAATGNERGAASLIFTNGSLTVTATARSLDNTAMYYPYLDDLSGGLPAGLGVCKVLNSANQCVPSSDDNITRNEVLTLTFNQPVTIDQFTFRNGAHQTVFTGNFGGVIDPIAPPTTVAGFTQLPAQATVFGPFTGTSFSLISNSTISGNSANSRQLYVSTVTANATPEPASLGLAVFGAGLLFTFRKRLIRKSL